jgi:hypothetical protein
MSLYEKERSRDLLLQYAHFPRETGGETMKNLSQDGGDTNWVSLKYEALLLRNYHSNRLISLRGIPHKDK